jgi:hypothetical protein
MACQTVRESPFPKVAERDYEGMQKEIPREPRCR